MWRDEFFVTAEGGHRSMRRAAGGHHGECGGGDQGCADLPPRTKVHNKTATANRTKVVGWLHRCPSDRQDRHTLLYEDDDKALLYMKEGCDGLMVDTGVSFACGKSGAPRRVGRLHRKGRSPPRARHARQTIDELIRQVRDPAAAAARGNDRQRLRRLGKSTSKSRSPQAQWAADPRIWGRAPRTLPIARCA